MGREIIDIKCPYCRDVYLHLSKSKYLDTKWECSKCVYTFPHNWFNECFQFEKFVTRK